MKTAYFDCLSGASGDMILSACLDAGLPEEFLRAGLKKLKLDTFNLQVQKVVKNGFEASQVRIEVQPQSPPRRLSEIQSVLLSSDLHPTIREKAVKIFERLARVEAGIHGVDMTEVHLHELSGDDTIADITGTLLCIEELGIKRLVVSPVPLGRGFVDSAHGKIPLPAPATLELLKKVPITGSPYEVETVTPTAALLFSELAENFGTIPAMTLEAVGYGAGSRDLPVPNILRLLIGDSWDSPGTAAVETLNMLESNLDDFNPQFFEPVITHLFQAGAVDVFLTPIHMKKNRPGILLSVLCHPPEIEALEQIIFTETSTLGIRRRFTERHALSRKTILVQTKWGKVRIKIAGMGEYGWKFAPEYEDCRAIAEQHNIPLQEIYLEAQIEGQRWLMESARDASEPGNSAV